MKTDSDHDEATSLSAPSRSDKDDSSASIEKHHYKLALAEPTACPARKVKGKEQDHDKEIDTEQVVALKEHGDEHTTLAILESNDPTDCQTKTNQNKITVKQNTQSEQHTSRPGAFRIRGIADGGDEYDEEATVTIGYSAAAPRPIDATHSQTNIIASENKTAAGVNLIQAEMVPELVTAVAKREEDSDEDKIPRRKKCLCVLICIAFIIVIVGTVVGPVFGGGEPQRAGPVPAPSLMPSSTTSPTKHVGNLFTTLNYTHAFFGHMFDVTAKKDVVITGMDIHLDSTDDETIVLWTKPGTWINYDNDEFQWAELGKVEVAAQGRGSLTALPKSLFNMARVNVKAGEKRAFYVSSPSDRIVFFQERQDENNNDLIEYGLPVYSNDDIIINVGTGVSHKFAGHGPPNVFNGNIEYVLD